MNSKRSFNFDEVKKIGVLCRVRQAMDLREMADYKRKFSRQGAERNIQAAEEAIKLAESILKGH